MKQHSNAVWITVLVLGWLLDFLFWKQGQGLNFALYAGLCLVAGFWFLRLDRIRMAPRSRWIILLILIFAAVTFLRAEPLTMSLAVLLTLFLMAVLAITYEGGRWLEYSLQDYARSLLAMLASVLVRPLVFRAEVARDRRAQTPARASDAWPVLRGVLIALPVVVIFAALLGSADLVFGNGLQALLRFLRLENLPQYIFRLVYIALAAYALLGVFLHAATQSGDASPAAEGRSLLPRFLGFVEAAIVLGSVVFLFAAFVAVQFRYFFGGQANIHVDGFTYSEYARRGFGELMLVAFFSLLMVLGLGAVTRRESPFPQRLFSALSVAVVVLVSVMLVSAYLRLGLYEAAYGFSRLRTYVHVSLIWLGLLLGAVVVLEILRRERQFAIAALTASLGFALTLAALNVDAFVVRQNVGRALQGRGLDVPYLASLSTDSLPALAGILEDSNMPGLTRDAVGAVLFCRLRAVSSGPSSADWRSFTLSRWLAEGDLRRVGPGLAGYHFLDDRFNLLTPGGVKYNCYGGD